MTVGDNSEIENTNAESRHLCHYLCGLYTYPVTQWPLTEHLLCPKYNCAAGPASPPKVREAKAAMPGTKHPLNSSLAHSGLASLETRLVLRAFPIFFGNVTKPLRTVPIVNAVFSVRGTLGAMVRHTLTAIGIVSTFSCATY